jgi:hypothetical protein
MTKKKLPSEACCLKEVQKSAEKIGQRGEEEEQQSSLSPTPDKHKTQNTNFYLQFLAVHMGKNTAVKGRKIRGVSRERSERHWRLGNFPQHYPGRHPPPIACPVQKTPMWPAA